MKHGNMNIPEEKKGFKEALFKYIEEQNISKIYVISLTN